MQDEQLRSPRNVGDLVLSLRVAQEQDREFCRRLHHEAYHDVIVRQFGSWDQTRQDAFFAEKWIPDRINLICVNGEPAGCFCRTVMPDHIWIAEIQLLSKFQGQGIGTELLKFQITEAISRSISVRLQVLKANEKAITLYTRLGFLVTGETETHRLMEWKLDDKCTASSR